MCAISLCTCGALDTLSRRRSTAALCVLIMASRKVSPLKPPRVLAEVGGPVDESSATIAVYGEDLEPHDITALIGVEPSNSFRRGFKRGPRSPAMPHGAWFLEVRGVAPDGPAVQLETLLAKLPDSAHVWQQLRERYTVQLRIALHMQSWNKGFSLTKQLTARLAALGVDLKFDLYAHGQQDA
jgi:uncharacterized protein DUF4279